jgi:hypothetical protein
MLWFTIVFLVLLKIPIAYLCYVVWWAVKDPPAPGEGFAGAGAESDSGGPDSPTWWKQPAPRRPPLRRGPHGAPDRRPAGALARRHSRT